MKGTTTTAKPPRTDKATGRGTASAEARRAQSAEAKAKMVAAGLAAGGKKKP